MCVRFENDFRCNQNVSHNADDACTSLPMPMSPLCYLLEESRVLTYMHSVTTCIFKMVDHFLNFAN